MRLKVLWLSLVFGLWLAVQFWPTDVSPACRLTILDVGQGDAILIQTPDHQDMLVDGGPSSKIVELLPHYLGSGNRNLELIVLTHPDSDHLTGLVSVAKRFEIMTLLTSGVSTDTATWHAWRKVLAERSVDERVVQQGEQFQLGSYLKLEILWPFLDAVRNSRTTATNEWSVGISLTCAGSTTVMVGDASSEVEERITASGVNVRASLLKVGHHGSRFSTSHSWLRAVQPRIAVISVGSRNRYHHPHPTTLRRLEYFRVEVHRTDLEGTLEFETDGRGNWRLTKT
ncbi:MAG: MBL fold metallo-hydrolase [Candidatus Kerfeldbacteria bacterium]|nr:MBL fold metallo-hydrolase [Candidatus Kerfeldbacteria bacterium]